MGGCRCSYKNCANTTKTRENLHFFHYPVKQKDRCRQWIENANKPQFYNLDEDQLRNKVICETHFEDCYFPNSQKKRLLQGAIPTLDGDCEQKPVHQVSMKIQDVQVLPANADGTIFVLETNMQNNFQSAKVESYIYTNNGLMVPINKCGESSDNSMLFSENDIEEIGAMQLHKAESEGFTPVSATSTDTIHEREFESCPSFESDSQNTVENIHLNSVLKSKSVQQKQTQIEEPKHIFDVKITDDLFTRSVGSKYVKKIKQHSKDIALLKRILKSKRPCRKPSNTIILNVLKKQLPRSLYNIVSMNLNANCDLTGDDLEFFITLFALSPQVYETLFQRFKWKLPDPILLSKLIMKNNGEVSSEEN